MKMKYMKLVERNDSQIYISNTEIHTHSHISVAVDQQKEEKQSPIIMCNWAQYLNSTKLNAVRL